MIIQTVDGNLLKAFKAGKFDAIVHGCNCYHTMGAGIAGQISTEFPEALEMDKKTDQGAAKLGDFSSTKTAHGWIINMYTQHYPGRENPEVILSSLRKGFSALNELLDISCQPLFDAPSRRVVVGIPQIGAGIAGGNWENHARVINEVTPNFDIILVNYKPD